MRVVIQKVSEAKITVEGKPISSIGKGLLVLLGIEDADKEDDIDWLTKKNSAVTYFQR